MAMNQIEISRTTYKVSDFVSWQKNKSLELSPSFQRRPVWKPDAKSYLIDTVVRGLPMPIIFLRERSSDLTTFEPKREVVDGQQRIRTLISYIDPKLLKDYRPEYDGFEVKAIHNSDLAGKPFEKLAPKYQRRILDYQFSVHVLPAETDDREILQIFARMNATGVKLNAQELRNADFFGPFKTAMYSLASEQLPKWRSWKIFTEQSLARMDEVELVSEFALMMLKGLSRRTPAILDSIYAEYDQAFPEQLEVERRFRAVMDSIEDNLGGDLAELPFRQRTLFYSLFSFVYDSLFKLGSPLKLKKAIPLTPSSIRWVKSAGKAIAERTAPEDVLDATAHRTTDLSSRQTILNYLKKTK